MDEYPWKPTQIAHAQVLKKLESTKQRLVKQPEHALSYDTQVKMEEMKLSRKLTE